MDLIVLQSKEGILKEFSIFILFEGEKSCHDHDFKHAWEALQMVLNSLILKINQIIIIIVVYPKILYIRIDREFQTLQLRARSYLSIPIIADGRMRELLSHEIGPLSNFNFNGSKSCALICQTIDFVEIYRTNSKTASKKVSRDMCLGKYWDQMNVVYIFWWFYHWTSSRLISIRRQYKGIRESMKEVSKQMVSYGVIQRCVCTRIL